MSDELEKLAVSQGVKPMDDVKVLFGTWPDVEEDGFETQVSDLRRCKDIER